MLAGDKFPPRYAGMEDKIQESGLFPSSFPRATRGWKMRHGRQIHVSVVSPALRGNGRMYLRPSAHPAVFPQRSAGMEGCPEGRSRENWCFPRTTRGWCHSFGDLNDLRLMVSC